MARYTDPDEARAYLNSLSDHPDRPGDTSKLNPQFAISMANAIAQAREAGMPVRLLSGQREGSVTGSAYDTAGYSSHIYGLASDVEGIGAAGSDTASQWRKIAQANGLNSPYNPNGSEWNHWQIGPKLETSPALLNNLKSAYATGDMTKVWAAASPVTGGTETASAQPFKPYQTASLGGTPPPSGGASMNPADHAAFIQDYAKKIGVDPNLALSIANAEGLRAWSSSNPNAGSYVDRTNGQPWSFGDFQLSVRNGLGTAARQAGIDPADPKQWQAADQFALDQMKKSLSPWSGDPAYSAYLKTGKAPDMSYLAKGGTYNQAASIPAPGTTLTSNEMDPSAQHGGPGAPLGTPGSTVNPTPPNASTAVAGAPPAAAAPPQNVGDIVKNLVTKPTTTDAKGNVTQGKSPLQNLASDLGTGNKQPAPAPAAPQQQQMLPVQDPNAGLAPASQQLFSQVQQAAAKPLSWTPGTPGAATAGTRPSMPAPVSPYANLYMPGMMPGMTLNTSGYGYG